MIQRMIGFCLMIGLLVACQSQQTNPKPTYKPPLNLKLYACIEPDCEVKATIAANTPLTIEDTIILEEDTKWLFVRTDDMLGYIGKWERNFPYAFDKVRSCAGLECPIIDTLDENTLILMVDSEMIDVIQSWTRIIYDENKVGYVGPKMPGPSKSSQMIAEATRNALTATP